MGGFTTYGTLAVGAGQMLVAGHLRVGALYSVGSVAVGVLVATLGVWLGTRSQQLSRRDNAAISRAKASKLETL